MNALMGAIFWSLSVEVGALVLLVAPWPEGFLGPILRTISASKALESAVKPALYFFGLVLATFLFSAREVVRLGGEYAEKRSGDIGQKLLHEVLMYRSQRDFYLAGFTALLLLVLRRIYLLVKEVHSLKATTVALKRQAEQASAAYTMQLTEVEELKKTAKMVAAAAKTDVSAKASADDGPLDADAIEERAKQAAADALMSPKAAAAARGEGDGESVFELKEECKRLREVLGQAREDGRKADANADAMRRQAENLSREYAKLMAQKESLENKLADFELVMGDRVKKAK